MNTKFKFNNIWNKCESLANGYFRKAVELMPQIKQFERSFEPARYEYAVQSRYMHRGFYCPSLILEYVIDNVKRGRIAKRITSKTKPTNAYFFDEDNIMRITETYYPNKGFTTEYLFYEDNIIYGITCEPDYRITMISIEVYIDNRIQSYMCAFYGCTTSKPYRITCENYRYENSCVEGEWYDMISPWCGHKGMVCGDTRGHGDTGTVLLSPPKNPADQNKTET